MAGMSTVPRQKNKGRPDKQSLKPDGYEKKTQQQEIEE